MRRFLWLSLGALLLACVAVASSGAVTQAEARWVITDLGTLGGKYSKAVAINERGQVIGTSETGEKDGDGNLITHAFLWQKGKMIDLGTLPGRKHSVPTAINDRGQIVGYGFPAYDPEDEERPMHTHAFLWERGKMRDLGTFGDAASWAVAINDHGQVVVQTFRKPRYLVVAHAFLWRAGKATNLGSGASSVNFYDETASVLNDRGQVLLSRMGAGGAWTSYLWQTGRAIRIGTLPGDRDSSAHAINDHGQVIGSSFGKNGEEHAFLWQEGRLTRLGQLGLGSSSPTAINERGQVVGESFVKVGVLHPFLWQRGKMIDLGDLRPWVSWAWVSWARDINDLGQVVGQSGHGFLWERGKLIDLGTLPGKSLSSEAVDINERGEIAGFSHTGKKVSKWESPDEHAVLWTLKP